ncbi:MAG: Na+/H+ antiporter NhaA [Candidatus Kapaibacteriota bacterium]|jgi:NhaA family Na+:H+ antiporter
MFKKNIYKTNTYNNFQQFYKSTSASGILLILSAFLAIIWSNSIFGASYHHFFETPLSLTIGNIVISYTIHHWINDGLMVVFFFMVGLEIKRELFIGELASLKQALLPILGAVGGMVVPALMYVLVNYDNPESLKGWAIPMATDIAFALGVLSLLGNRVPIGLKVFLAALAIVDDLGAVLVIALFYTSTISYVALAWIGLFLFLLFLANRLHINYPLIYLLIGIGLWFAFMASGIHSTIAGVLSAFMIPLSSVIVKNDFRTKVDKLWKEFKKIDIEIVTNDTLFQTEEENKLADEQLYEQQYHILHKLSDLSIKVQPALHRLEHNLDKWVGLIIMPIFALANCGVDLSNFTFKSLIEPVSLGIIIGLFIGKIVGVYSAVYLAIKFKIASLPENVNLKHIFGVSILCAIGFTMSLFVTGLSFGTGSEYENFAKIGILTASISAGILGYIYLNNHLKNEIPD